MDLYFRIRFLSYKFLMLGVYNFGEIPLKFSKYHLFLLESKKIVLAILLQLNSSFTTTFFRWSPKKLKIN